MWDSSLEKWGELIANITAQSQGRKAKVAGPMLLNGYSVSQESMLLFLYKKDLNPIRLPILLAMSVYVFTSHSLLWYLSICSRKSFRAQLGHSVSIQSIILGVVRDFHFCKSSFLATNRALRRHPSWLEHRSLLWHPWTFYGWLEVLQAQKREKIPTFIHWRMNI